MLNLAERGGFEPPVALRLRQFSKLIHSTTLSPLLRVDLSQSCILRYSHVHHGITNSKTHVRVVNCLLNHPASSCRSTSSHGAIDDGQVCHLSQPRLYPNEQGLGYQCMVKEIFLSACHDSLIARNYF